MFTTFGLYIISSRDVTLLKFDFFSGSIFLSGLEWTYIYIYIELRLERQQLSVHQPSNPLFCILINGCASFNVSKETRIIRQIGKYSNGLSETFLKLSFWDFDRPLYPCLKSV